MPSGWCARPSGPSSWRNGSSPPPATTRPPSSKRPASISARSCRPPSATRTPPRAPVRSRCSPRPPTRRSRSAPTTSFSSASSTTSSPTRSSSPPPAAWSKSAAGARAPGTCGSPCATAARASARASSASSSPDSGRAAVCASAARSPKSTAATSGRNPRSDREPGSSSSCRSPSRRPGHTCSSSPTIRAGSKEWRGRCGRLATCAARRSRKRSSAAAPISSSSRARTRAGAGSPRCAPPRAGQRSRSSSFPASLRPRDWPGPWRFSPPERVLALLVMLVRMGRALAVLLFLAGPALPADRYPAYTGYVVDTAGVLDAQSVQRIRDTASRLDHAGVAQVSVLTVRDLGDQSPEEYAVGAFKQWGLGHKAGKKDDGVLVLMVPGAPGHRRTKVETGYDIEGVLPDGKLGAIYDRVARPYILRNDYGGAASSLVDAIAGELEQDAASGGTSRPIAGLQRTRRAGDGIPGVAGLALAIVCMVVLLVSLASHGARRRFPGR